VAEQIDDPADDEKTDPQSIGSRRAKTMKRLEYPRKLVRRYAAAGVYDLDADIGTPRATSKQHAAAPRRVFEGIAYQIAQRDGEKRRLAM
jgi:hypothetical protein